METFHSGGNEVRAILFPCFPIESCPLRSGGRHVQWLRGLTVCAGAPGPRGRAGEMICECDVSGVATAVPPGHTMSQEEGLERILYRMANQCANAGGQRHGEGAPNEDPPGRPGHIGAAGAGANATEQGQKNQ